MEERSNHNISMTVEG